jgi:hypothetical protein
MFEIKSEFQNSNTYEDFGIHNDICSYHYYFDENKTDHYKENKTSRLTTENQTPKDTEHCQQTNNLIGTLNRSDKDNV